MGNCLDRGGHNSRFFLDVLYEWFLSQNLPAIVPKNGSKSQENIFLPAKTVCLYRYYSLMYFENYFPLQIDIQNRYGHVPEALYKVVKEIYNKNEIESKNSFSTFAITKIT